MTSPFSGPDNKVTLQNGKAKDPYNDANHADHPIFTTSTNNTDTVIIRITEDRLRNYLRDFNDISAYPGYLLGSAGIAVTLFITLVTVEKYRDKFGLTASVWEAIFVILCALTVLSVVYFFYQWVVNFKKLKLNYLIKKIKGDKSRHATQCYAKSLLKKKSNDTPLR